MIDDPTDLEDELPCSIRTCRACRWGELGVWLVVAVLAVVGLLKVLP